MNTSLAPRPKVLAYALGVTTLFCIINAAQRFTLGASPLDPAGYLFPAIVGAISGTLIARTLLRVQELNAALDARVAHLERLLPICASCKSIRRRDSDPEREASWMRIEQYLHEEAGQLLTHGLCPGCSKDLQDRYQAAPTVE